MKQMKLPELRLKHIKLIGSDGKKNKRHATVIPIEASVTQLYKYMKKYATVIPVTEE